MATFGKTTTGESAVENGWKPSCILTKVIAPEYGKITAIGIHLYWGAEGESAKGVIFSHDVINDRPLIKLAEGDSLPVTHGQFNILTGLNYDMTPGEILWIGAFCEGAPYSSGDPPGRTFVWATDTTYPTAPTTYAPLFSPFITDLQAAIYATYTPSVAPPLSIDVNPKSASLIVGQSQTFTATIQGGQPPYTVNWIDNITKEIIGTGETFVFNATQEGKFEIYAEAADSVGDKVESSIIPIVVTAPPATHMLTVNSTPQGIPFTIEEVI